LTARRNDDGGSKGDDANRDYVPCKRHIVTKANNERKTNIDAIREARDLFRKSRRDYSCKHASARSIIGTRRQHETMDAVMDY